MSLLTFTASSNSAQIWRELNICSSEELNETLIETSIIANELNLNVTPGLGITFRLFSILVLNLETLRRFLEGCDDGLLALGIDQMLVTLTSTNYDQIDGEIMESLKSLLFDLLGYFDCGAELPETNVDTPPQISRLSTIRETDSTADTTTSKRKEQVNLKRLDTNRRKTSISALSPPNSRPKTTTTTSFSAKSSSSLLSSKSQGNFSFSEFLNDRQPDRQEGFMQIFETKPMIITPNEDAASRFIEPNNDLEEQLRDALERQRSRDLYLDEAVRSMARKMQSMMHEMEILENRCSEAVNDLANAKLEIRLLKIKRDNGEVKCDFGCQTLCNEIMNTNSMGNQTEFVIITSTYKKPAVIPLVEPLQPKITDLVYRNMSFSLAKPETAKLEVKVVDSDIVTYQKKFAKTLINRASSVSTRKSTESANTLKLSPTTIISQSIQSLNMPSRSASQLSSNSEQTDFTFDSSLGWSFMPDPKDEPRVPSLILFENNQGTVHDFMGDLMINF